MTVILALVRKHLIEARWMLGLCSAAFLAISLLTVWITSRVESEIAQGNMGNDLWRFRALGGPAMDFSTTALEICWWNHPVLILTLLSWAMTRGTTAVAGEIERGTIDLTLSRPVPRRDYLASHVLFAAFGLVCLIAALIAGNFLGSALFPLKAPPTLLTLLKPAAMMLALGLGVFGYTVPLSSLDVVRWRPALASGTITMAGLVGMSVAPQFSGFRWLEHLSIFNLYAPVTAAVTKGGGPLAADAAWMLTVFALGTALAFALFARRDVPSNS